MVFLRKSGVDVAATPARAVPMAGRHAAPESRRFALEFQHARPQGGAQRYTALHRKNFLHGEAEFRPSGEEGSTPAALKLSGSCSIRNTVRRRVHLSSEEGYHCFPPHTREDTMNILVILIILLLLFGGGGYYFGGPAVGGSLGGIILLVLIVMLLTGRRF
jgi:hypothetical protein